MIWPFLFGGHDAILRSLVTVREGNDFAGFVFASPRNGFDGKAIGGEVGKLFDGIAAKAEAHHQVSSPRIGGKSADIGSEITV